MTDRKEKLQALLDAAKASAIVHDGAMFEIFGDKWLECFDAYNGSFDAFLALHAATVPDRPFSVTFGGGYGATVTFAPTWDATSLSWSNHIPSRAGVCAILHSLINEDGT